MSDELYRKLINASPGKAVFRRRRKHQGSDWTPEASSALSGDGVWCPACRQRHGYKSQLLVTKYEKRSGKWYIHWVCSKTGDYLKEQALGTV